MNVYTWDNIRIPSTPQTVYKIEVKSFSPPDPCQMITAALTGKALPQPLQAELVNGMSHATAAPPILGNYLDIIPSVTIYAKGLPERSYRVVARA
ncbi:MAG TPA: hypothetical protein VF646_01450 [Cytophagales bacterium]|jgi:hypothetical protein